MTALGQRRVLREIYPGLMHFLIFWGSLLLILGKIIRLFSFAVDLTHPPQAIFLYASCISEIGGAMVILGTGMAVYRRYIARPSRLDTKPDDTLILLWGFLLLLTGYWVKGYRIAASEAVIPPDWLGVGANQFPLFATPAHISRGSENRAPPLASDHDSRPPRLPLPGLFYPEPVPPAAHLAFGPQCVFPLPAGQGSVAPDSL